METTEYDTQAAEFLARFGLEVKVELRTPETCPPWSEAQKVPDRIRLASDCPRCKNVHGREYLVTLTRKDGAARRGYRPLSFPFWGAHADRPNPNEPAWSKKGRGKHPSAYDVLACLSSDISTPDDPDEIVEEFGPMKPSRALAIAAHGRTVREWFTEAERDALQEIQ